MSPQQVTRSQKPSLVSGNVLGSDCSGEQHLLPADSVEQGARKVFLLEALFILVFIFLLSFLDFVSVLLCCFNLRFCIRLAICFRRIWFSTWCRRAPMSAAACSAEGRCLDIRSSQHVMTKSN